VINSGRPESPAFTLLRPELPIEAKWNIMMPKQQVVKIYQLAKVAVVRDSHKLFLSLTGEFE
jgi:hypothetical protein